MNGRTSFNQQQQKGCCSPTKNSQNAIANAGELVPSSSSPLAAASPNIATEGNVKTQQRPQKLFIPPSFRQKMDTNYHPLNCKICLQRFTEPYTTVCGHTFCRACIVKSLQFSSQCPVCDSGLDAKRARICGTPAPNSATAHPNNNSNNNNGNGSANNSNSNTALIVNNNVVLCPNYTVAELFEHQQKTADTSFGAQTAAQSYEFMADTAQTERSIINMILSDRQLPLDSLRRIEEKLRQKRAEMELNDTRMSALLLHNFLELMIEKRDQTLRQVQAELELLKQDRQRVFASLINDDDQQQQLISAPSLQQLVPDLSANIAVAAAASAAKHPSASTPVAAAAAGAPCQAHQGIKLKQHHIIGGEEHSGSITKLAMPSLASSSASIGIGTQLAHIAMPERVVQLRHRMLRHVPSLETAYLSLRVAPVQKETAETPAAAVVGTTASATIAAPSTTTTTADSLDEFSLLVKNMYRYGEVKVLTTLNYNIDAYNLPSIVSSIEFDKDGDFFVIAGVTKMIKLYDFNALMDHCGGTDQPPTTAGDHDGITTPAFVHQPMVQLRCNSKISNVSWNPYNKHMLVSSDYDGTVQLWDTAAAKCTRTFGEHEKRCWTVQFNSIDPHLMASGSDDGKVKLWSVMCPQSLCAIDAKVNVCCVYFSPKSRDQLVFGASDHCVHLYDLRQMSKPLNIFRGHRKAVSYVKYANENEVVSASTDSNLRLWDVSTGKCLQTMRGHQNEKNFVGLATDGTHVICGSENNQLYMYYKAIGEPLLSFDFGKRCVSYPSPPVVPPAAPHHSAFSSSSNPTTDFLAASTTADFTFTGHGNTIFGTGGPSPWHTPSPSVELHHTVAGTVTGTNSSSTALQQQPTAGSGDFVSAVCWKRNSNIVLAANSQGQTFVLRLE
ncbi:hypothetical protein niasHS_000011 [Heterodera schachtii]|uniref:RING-type domain-containing protein n=1 Tax=Heterodera schachtii TaxID=97005 RepID=A0ABD2K6E2_HETSC